MELRAALKGGSQNNHRQNRSSASSALLNAGMVIFDHLRVLSDGMRIYKFMQRMLSFGTLGLEKSSVGSGHGRSHTSSDLSMVLR